MGKRIAIIGASGGIGEAFVHYYLRDESVERIYAFARSDTNFANPKVVSRFIDIIDENSIASAVLIIESELDTIIVATGILHNNYIYPEKSLQDLSIQNFQEIFAINTFGPALVAKYFCPLMTTSRPSVFAALSARVGSISDNYLGGWYAYRASKSALNMIVKNISIEMTRKNKQACIIGLHPGTTDTSLSKPFQSYVQEDKLFTPQYAVSCMSAVIEQASPEKSGKIIAWDGDEIDP